MKKSRKILLIMAFVVLLGLIYMPSKTLATEEKYSSIVIGMNQGLDVNDGVEVKLVLGVHESEKLKIIVKDTNYDEVENPKILWSSSNENVVTIDSNGTLLAKGEGTATITATGGGISKSRPVKVSKLQSFVDFSDVKFTWNNTYWSTSLEVESNLYKDKDIRTFYKIIVNDEKAEIKEDEHGSISLNENDLSVLPTDGKIYLMEQYVEKYKNISILIVQSVSTLYYKEDGNHILNVNKVERIRLDEFEFPTFSGAFTSSFISSKMTQIILNEPCASPRKFTIKVGKITDENILNKIKNGDKDGFANLEVFAKENKPIFEGKVESTNSDKITYKDEILPLDGKLEDKEYYYLYIILDDENEKYVPIEHCLTFGQAYVQKSDETGSWSVHMYGDDKFNWKEFSTENTGGDYTPTGTDGTIKVGNSTGTDQTTSTATLPHTGIGATILGVISVLCVIFGITYYKNNKYKGI